MPESKKSAEARAKKGGFPKSNVVKANSDGYYIAPKGIKSTAAKKAYANCRASGNSKVQYAKVSWTVEKNKK